MGVTFTKLKGIIASVILALPIFSSSQSLNIIKPDGIGGFWYIDGIKTVRVDEEGKTLCSFSNIQLGNPKTVDPTDPFRVIAFFEVPQQIQVISSIGTPLAQPIDLSLLNIGTISVVCKSSRGGVWLYNQEGNEIVLTNNLLTRIEQRISLLNIEPGSVPNFLTEANGILYLGVNNNLIERFDTYGVKLEPLDIEYSEHFIVDNKHLWVQKGNKIEKRELDAPTIVVAEFLCVGKTLPLVIKGKPMSFDGKKFISCEKISDNPM